MHNIPEYPGFFLALEGACGAGKTTQAKRLADWLSGQGYCVKATREGGGTVLGEKLRDLIEDFECARLLATAPRSLLFLVLASRNLHVQRVIRPALSEGKIVVCERFEGSTYATQHYADQLEQLFLQGKHHYTYIQYSATTFPSKIIESIIYLKPAGE